MRPISKAKASLSTPQSNVTNRGSLNISSSRSQRPTTTPMTKAAKPTTTGGCCGRK